MKMTCCDLCDLVFCEMYGEIEAKTLINGQDAEKFGYVHFEKMVMVKMNVCKRCNSKHPDLNKALNEKKEEVNQIYNQIKNFNDAKDIYFRTYWLNFTRKFGKLENEVKE